MTHRDDVLAALTTLFDETGRAHQQAFVATRDEDSDWAAWYAHYAHDRLEALLDADLPEGQLAALFEEIEERREADSGGRDWPEYYAEAFLERFPTE